jgi:DNA-binding response OmpR family regulator
LNREQLLALTHNESTEVFDRTIDVLIAPAAQNRVKPASADVD